MVSVIIPTYNRAEIVLNAIDSVRNQIYQDWELIVVDDRSTDNTQNKIKLLQKTDSRIKYYNNEKNNGPSGARNFGIEKANGDYLAFLDSDDTWLQSHLEECINAIKKYNLNASFSFWYEQKDNHLYKSNEVNNLDETLEKAIQNSAFVKGDEDNVILSCSDFFEYFLFNPMYFYHINTLVMRKDLIESIGSFNEKLRGSEDIDFIYRILYLSNFAVVKNYHFIYNEGADNLYMFKGRYKLNINDIPLDKQLVERFTIEGLFKNEMRKERIKFIRKADRVKSKKEAIKIVKEWTAKKYRFMGFVNSKHDLKKAIRFYIHSLYYEMSLWTIILTIKSAFRFKVYIEPESQHYFDTL